MNKRVFLMLFFAFLLAAFAAWVANRWIQSKVVRTTPSDKTIVIAATQIPFGVKLDGTHVKLLKWQGGDIPEDSFSTKEEVIGKITKHTFFENEMITKKRVGEHLGGSTLSAVIKNDSRAITIRVNDVIGVAGFVLPGNRVDILSSKKNKNKVLTKTILENIKVLAVDQEASPDKEKPAVVRAVTLELTPKEAEKIVSAMQEGTIQLTLRNPRDSAIAEKEEVKVKKKKRAYTPPSISVIPWGGNERRCFGNAC